MDTKKSESENLKAQIKYLTDLINSAKNSESVKHKKPRTKASNRPQLHSSDWMNQQAPVQLNKGKDFATFYQTKVSSFYPSATKSRYSFISRAPPQLNSQQMLSTAMPQNVDFKMSVNPTNLSYSVFNWKSSNCHKKPSASLFNKKSFQIPLHVLKKDDENQHITCAAPSDKKDMIAISLQDNGFRTDVHKKMANVKKSISLVDPTYKMIKSSFPSSKEGHILNSTAKPVTATREKSICSLKQQEPKLSPQKISEITDTIALLNAERQKSTCTKTILENERQQITEMTGVKAALDTETQKRTGTIAELDTEMQKMTTNSIKHSSPSKESSPVIYHTESSMKKIVDKLKQDLRETEFRMLTLKTLIGEQTEKLVKMPSTKSQMHNVFHNHVLNRDKLQLTSYQCNSSQSKDSLFRKAHLTETKLHSVSSDDHQTKVEKVKGLNSVSTRFKILNKSNNQQKTGTHGNVEKKIIQTRYSIRKMSDKSELTLSDKKQTGPIFVTHYKLRRSFNTNSETLPVTNRQPVKRSSSCDASHAQYVANTIKSKYKIKKVLLEQSKVSSPKLSPRNVSYHTPKIKWSPRNSPYWSTWKGNLKSRYTEACMYYSGYKRRTGQVYQDSYAGSKTSSSPSHVLKRRQKQNFLNIRNAANKVQYLKEHIPFNPMLRIDRRKKERKEIAQTGVLSSIPTNKMASSRTISRMRLRNRIIVKNVKSTCTKIFTINGDKFKMDSSGKRLQRISPVKAKSSSVKPLRSPISRVDIGGVTYIQTKPGTLEIDSSFKTRALASQVVHKSLVTAMAANYKKNSAFKLTAKQYCKFYNRFGKCNRGDKCPYIHDSDKIVICTRFLRGTCKVTDCPFSHKISKEKMPVCSFFLRGVCNRDDCPYQHVNVGKDAKLCLDFLNGYCPLGEKCKKRHILVCPHFTRTGSCPDGKQCKLVHRRTRKRTNSSISGKEITACKKCHLSQEESSELISTVIEGLSKADGDDVDLQFHERQLPSFISLGDSSIEELSFATTPKSEDKPAPSVRIRPQF